MYTSEEQKKIIKYAKGVTKKYGTSYYISTFFFPRRTREYVWLLYAFYREADNIVDEGNDDQKEKILSLLVDEWNNIFESHSVSSFLSLRAGYMVHQAFPLMSKTFSMAFFESMKMDLYKNRYETYEDLEKYMYGSAGIVGIMMNFVMGGNEKSMSYAEKLGYGMQLTNFLRDIHDDYESRGRIYMPQKELDTFSITDEDIRTCTMKTEWVDFLKYQIERAHSLFREASVGIDMLPWRVRFAVRLASNLYEEILYLIESNDYDIWGKRIRTTTNQKMSIIWRTIWNKKK